MIDNRLKEHVQDVKEKVAEAGDGVKRNAQEAKGSINRVVKTIKKILLAIGLFVVSAAFFCAGMYVSTIFGKDGTTEITNVHIEEKLEAIGQLSTYSFEYTNQKEERNTRKIFGTTIPGTTNEVKIIYSGVIKVGYEIARIDYDVNNTSKKIFITIPEVQVFDNYIKFDDLQIREENNILNPIATESIVQYFEDIKEEELQIAEEKGIYDLAEEQLKMLIEALLAGFSDYTVVFKN